MVAELQAVYPDLAVTADNDRVVVAGPFRLVDGAVEVHRYDIALELPLDFPEGVPILREVGSRIPRDADHHINPDGTACLFVSGERWRHWPPGSSLIQFLDGPVRSYLIGQALVELGQPWPFGQRSHGAHGVLEAYGDMIGSADPQTIARYIRVLARAKLRRHRPCPCGGGRPLRDCHLMEVLTLRDNITQREAEAAQQQIHAELPLLFPTLSRPTPTRHTPAGFRRFPIPRRRS
jgi:hypothetical protein